MNLIIVSTEIACRGWAAKFANLKFANSRKTCNLQLLDSRNYNRSYGIALAACMHFLCPLRKFSIDDTIVYSVRLFHLNTYSEVKRTMVTKYSDSMGLAQSQLTNVEVCLSWQSPKVSPVLKWVWTVASFPCPAFVLPENEAMKEIVASFPGSSPRCKWGLGIRLVNLLIVKPLHLITSIKM